jgi:hypothetical protein
MSDIASNNTVLPKENPSSLSGNAAGYQSGGKRKKASKKTVKKSKKSPKSRSSKKCWWKLW